MTPTTPTGERSTVADIFAISNPGERYEVRIADSAWRAAHAMWPAASAASNFASLVGFPVSWETSADSSSILASKSVLHLSRTLRRPRKPRSRHICEAARAVATALRTSDSVCCG